MSQIETDSAGAEEEGGMISKEVAGKDSALLLTRAAIILLASGVCVMRVGV